jgi:DnaJ-class molecular chaperone
MAGRKKEVKPNVVEPEAPKKRKFRCAKCLGTGKIKVRVDECPNCHGTGEIEYDD